jgi:L-lactate dehydrogenase
MTPPRYQADDLRRFARRLFVAAGLDRDMASVVANTLVEGDLLGRTTHGLAMLAPYLADIESGRMARSGEPVVLRDLPAAVTWDGQRLPGPWLVTRALDLAAGRARQHGACTVVIRRSHHIGCLAAYLEVIADLELAVILMCSDPTAAGVVPHGGCRQVLTPNPIAAAWPTDGDPIVIDVSMSTTSNAMMKRLGTEGKRLPGIWAVTGDGDPTDDPALALAEPAGGLLPIGGLDHGHKGFALGLLVEMLTGGLAGHGRADPSEGWTGTVFLQVFDPELFGGRDAFLRQTSWVARACADTPPRRGVERVQLPGEGSRRRHDEQLANGVALHPAIMPALEAWAARLGVPLPAAVRTPAGPPQ